MGTQSLYSRMDRLVAVRRIQWLASKTNSVKKYFNQISLTGSSLEPSRIYGRFY